MAAEWKQLGGISGNSILSGAGFYISYMPPGGLAGISLFAAEGNQAETALCIEKDSSTVYRILNGDFRKEYEALMPLGLAACEEFYEANKSQRSSWSTFDDDEEVA